MSQVRSGISTIIVALMVLFLAAASSASGAPLSAATTTIEERVCDIAADTALGLGDYRTAIELHQRLLQSDRNLAIAHYHLGFAYGMLGHSTEEINEYRMAIGLGLKHWDLFLNLGLAYFDQHEITSATTALETAVSLGPDHAETHFNLAVVYERENRLNEALQQIIASLVLAPEDLDAANTDAIICARMGDIVSARKIWTQLTQAAPEYIPARTNLATLDHSCGDACGTYVHSYRTMVLSPLLDSEVR